MKRKKLCLVLIVAILIMLLPTVAAAGADGYGDGYKDVPRDNWSYAEVNAAKKYGLMQGRGDGVFGFGSDITRAEFVTVLNNMFQWKTENPVQPSFSNVTKGKWYYSYIETALRHDVIDRASVFDADVPITREEMAVMLVRALGYKTLAQSMETVGTPFEDVTNNAGYITVASDIGMTKGTSKNAFSPKLTAKREEAAAMLVRVYEKYIGKTDWVHGFYAISSFSQKELSKGMDAVSVGWSRMSYSMDKGAYLNTTSVNGNEYVIPQGYEDIISYFKDNGTKPHLSIYMDTSTYVETEEGRKDICAAILLDGVERKKAVEAIINELTVDYKTIGYNPYSGVSIDFEGMKGNSLRVGFNDFLTDLSKALKPLGKTIYVAVHPATSDGAYYDAYDYRTIGHVADKVILMAHDYNATIMPENLIGSE
ncbi:MAG TPA: S-layer homology domain-containing protein, partial [Anaerovoracaceae bacterium]|nr:S-layer homology domain-containing protein [Anaerovoracaceae bacterium]